MGNGGKYDVIVIGAGHNGLTASALLAKQGRKVAVIEQASRIGGLSAGDEFHPGYHSAGLLHDTCLIRPQVVSALSLERHGLVVKNGRPPVLAIGSRNSTLCIHHDIRKTYREIARYSTGDADRYVKYRAFLRRIQGFVRNLMDTPPPKLDRNSFREILGVVEKGVALRRLGREDMMELLRICPMSVADWLNEWFETGLLKAALAWPAIHGSFAGPLSPGSNANLLLWETGTRSFVVGGPAALAAALAKAAESLGVEIHTARRVSRIVIGDRKVQGVVLEDGQRLESSIVAASCDPRHTFLDLLAPQALAHRLRTQIKNFRGSGTTAKVNLALSSSLKFGDRPAASVAFVRTGNDLMQIEKAFDAVKYRRFSDHPILDIHLPTVADPGLAPEGHAVASILVHFAPYHLDPPWDDAQREKLGDRVLAVLEECAPGATGAVVARQVLSPVDLETRYGLVEGDLHHGAHSLDQLVMRPVPSCAHYETPLPGLYICGSGNHPGGGITCGPGLLAASAIATRGIRVGS